jgi:MtN3 and saliva related transmembrane protein
MPDISTIIGLAAATLTTGAFIPQAIKTLRARSTKDISLVMYFVLTVGIALWLIYGLMRADLPVIAANAVTLIFVLTILLMKIKWG